jgi:hypothetical protein
MIILSFPLWFQVRTRPDRLGSVLIISEIRSFATNLVTKGLAVFRHKRAVNIGTPLAAAISSSPTYSSGGQKAEWRILSQ